MSGFEIYTPTAEEVHSGVLGRRMRQFNYGFVGEYGQSQPVWVSARDTHGELVGGLRGFVFLQWLNVDLLFVDEAARHQGVGRQLLATAEQKARDLGAHSVTLSTFEWQARAFYLQQGYEEFGHIDNYIQGFQLVYLKKALTPGLPNSDAGASTPSVDP
ncbi:MAG: GNAT family N-acetyltransferase [Acidovorax sp.]|uniref:GNAT family N-acetyltransferase n=1 Tax=Acidovorax sp. TaxID=1872122 RepID=UPI000A73A0E6|nr:GNAT family N-acetyltransferase [Acidovorax sp.]MDH4447866.1 GNAT family N-acetyltransferase [Acidovorax sp.]MDH4463769.1 GNAT family N-acetyltransferase [Acidovorax sp.]